MTSTPPAGRATLRPPFGYYGTKARLARRIVELPATRIIAKYGLADAVLYVASLPGVHPRGSGSLTGRDYSHDTATEDEHRELAYALHATSATVLLSGYASALYDD